VTGAPGFWVDPGELRALYEDWDVVHDGSRIVETAAQDEAGRPFRQPTDELAARKPAASA